MSRAGLYCRIIGPISFQKMSIRTTPCRSTATVLASASAFERSSGERGLRETHSGGAVAPARALSTASPALALALSTASLAVSSTAVSDSFILLNWSSAAPARLAGLEPVRGTAVGSTVIVGSAAIAQVRLSAARSCWLARKFCLPFRVIGASLRAVLTAASG